MPDKYTPQVLLAIAAEAEKEYERLLKIHPPGTFHEGRNDAYRLAEQALFCAEWMEKNGVAELANVGPFMTTRLQEGQRVTIKKGAVVCTTHPSKPKQVILERAQTVVVHSFCEGYVDPGHLRRDYKPTVAQGEVTWAGTGGYWRRTDINNVVIDEKEGA